MKTRMSNMNRREAILATTMGTLATQALAGKSALAADPLAHPFRYCLNTATIRGQNVGIVEEVKIAAKAGYDGIEPWIDTLDHYVKGGGSISDLRKLIADSGLKVESAIGFAAFLVDDAGERAKGLEEAKRCMDLVRSIGGTRLAAPPVGVTDKTDLNLVASGPRYAALLALGQQMGVLPMLELWGFSKSLSRLGEVACVGIEATPEAAAYLLDIYHIHKGGSDIHGLAQFPGERMFCFHVNDYPADPPRESISDEHRVFPGDGVAPSGYIYRTLREIGFRGALSLELFNRTYWSQDAFEVAKTGLEKTKATVAKALV